MIREPKPFHLSLEEMKDFRIRLDVIVKHDIWTTANWREPPAVHAMVGMLPIKDITELFEEVIQNRPYVDSEMPTLEEWLSLARAAGSSVEVRDENRKKIRDFLLNNDQAGAGDELYHYYYIYEHTFRGVNLFQAIEVSPEHPSFPILFGFRLAKTHFPDEFLTYHLMETYRGDASKFRLLLAQLDKTLLETRNEFVNEWREINLKPVGGHKRSQIPSKPKSSKAELKDYFDNYHQLEMVFRDFLFKSDGSLRPNKTLNLGQLAIALKEAMERKTSRVVSAELLTELIINCSFGKKLEIQFQSLRKYLTPKELKKIEPSIQLNKELKAIS